MATPGFGFSVGDFITGVSLVRKLIRALNDSAGGRAAYRQLISELLNLDEALTGVSNLELEPAQPAQKVALEQVASQCQLTIETFLDKNAKFKDTLGTVSRQLSPAPRWQINLHQVQWALCKDSAIQALRTEIRAHTATLNLLLSTIHISAVKLQNQTVNSCKDLVEKAQNQTNALAKQNHQLLVSHSELIVSISSAVDKITHRQEAQTTETSELESLVTKVMESNMRIFATVLQMQQGLSQIPAQVDRQQPVIFEDAHGRLAPFHVEFINSFAAFQAVLEARFQDVPGLKKVRNREYTMQDVASKKMLDLNRPWESIFRPGRRANMSMVFEYNEAMSSSCPGCLSGNTVVGYGANDEIRW
ncbi:hypothetical protein N8I77_012365 [Diaporthe amygdali]|uniref:Ubiquitin-like domain-containing protein n=1 Tax=Phomopsis amygdali TaxID=1214568 RepID=A0AAD9S5G8_PHOAM|nr:hypothetical protein N8I77_012365 [Diaporthe amygdali]